MASRRNLRTSQRVSRHFYDWSINSTKLLSLTVLLPGFSSNKLKRESHISHNVSKALHSFSNSLIRYPVLLSAYARTCMILISKCIFNRFHKYSGTYYSRLRHCATSRKVEGSIPDSVIGIFHWHIPSDRTMSLRSTQSPTEMCTTNISWKVKGVVA